MSVFYKELALKQPKAEGRRWLFVPYDQLTDTVGPLSREDPKSLGIVLVENAWKGDRRPYHKQKLALILTNIRHFALEQAERGIAVRHIVANGPYHTALSPLIPQLGTLRVMVPAERELREDLLKLSRLGGLDFIPHEGWLTTRSQFYESTGKTPPWKMERFYRRVRTETGILMKDGKPIGGKFNYDVENRLPWRGTPPAPDPPTFKVDGIKVEVGRLINKHFSNHPGQLNLKMLPATRNDAHALWQWAKEACLYHFGPYEDAMSRASRNLFHSRISALLNIFRLNPNDIVQDVMTMDIPLAGKEGFVRQILGWREFVYHVHTTTDGFRSIENESTPVAKWPGDGGYSTWSGNKWPSGKTDRVLNGGATPSFLGNEFPIPPVYWGEPSGLACLDHVVKTVWEDAYSHHITRLMVLSNLATLLDIRPRELTDWFWIAYADAYDWVVEPNVLGMGTFSLGDLMTTKPYVSGAAYIDRMGDYCEECSFNPKKNCPITPLYWAFLLRHEAALAKNPRLRMPMASLRKRKSQRQTQDQKVFKHVQDVLSKGGVLTPDNLP
jgi:deoxyribodipyrimidine photolyase-related protein